MYQSAWSEAGKRCVAAGWDGVVKIRDASTGRPTRDRGLESEVLGQITPGEAQFGMHCLVRAAAPVMPNDLFQLSLGPCELRSSIKPSPLAV